MALKASRGATFLLDDLGRIVGYIDGSGAERDFSGNPLPPSGVPTPSGFLAATYSNFSPLQFPRWRKAMSLVRSGAGRARLACTGDSTTFGLGSVGTPQSYSNAKASSYPTQLATVLGPQKNLLAHADSVWCDNGLATVAGATVPLADPRVALGAGWAPTGQGSMGGASFFNNTTNNALAFTPNNAFDTIDVWYVCNSGLGKFAVDIGGAALSPSPVDTTIGTHGALKATFSTGAAAATGTVNVKLSGTPASTFIIGVETYNSATPKVSVWNQGRCGGLASTLSDISNPWSWQNALVAAAPDLVVSGIGINDARLSVSLDTYTANYQQFITAVKAVSDMVMLIEVPSQTGVVPAAAQTQFVAAQYQLAAANNLPVIDLSQRWVSWAYSNPLGYYFDQLHPYAVGYGDISQAVINSPGLF